MKLAKNFLSKNYQHFKLRSSLISRIKSAIHGEKKSVLIREIRGR
jgi:hypothetical protein